MKALLTNILPNTLVERLRMLNSLRDWANRSFLGNSPQFIKQKVFIKYGIPDAVWVETGTYLGTTTSFLAKRFPHVHSIEPSQALYKKAIDRFNHQNVTLYNDVSEHVLPDLLPTIKGKVNFWLDGHFSGGITFQGQNNCPVEKELDAIQENMNNFDALTILIDDIRCFLPSTDEYQDYPSIDYLVDWARKHQFSWRIEHDIFIMQRSQ